jgi:hypothetical protein
MDLVTSLKPGFAGAIHADAKARWLITFLQA